MRAYVIGTAVAAMAALGMVSAAAAPRSAVAPTIALAPSAPAAGAPAAGPALGQSVAFVTTYSTTSYKNPRIIVFCSQNGVMVWGNVGLVDESYKLGGDASPWLNNGGGPADCEADLVNLTWVHKMETREMLASTTFTAAS
jgi:hypothetical protein